MVFALIDTPKSKDENSPKTDKYGELEKIKKLLDSEAITKEEFEQEKTKILAK